MKVFLAGVTTFLDSYLFAKDVKGAFVLESFFYANAKTEKYLPLYGDFLLDSGAYTFFSAKHKNIVWEDYVEKYADFIVRNNVKKFFELDIDKLIGYDNVLLLRKRLEERTNRQCIPVWHKTRGKEDYLKMCEEYKYISIGGLVGAGGAGSSAYSREVTKYFPWFINEAHKKGTKLHALGYTSIEGLHKYNFDSVDSTTWVSGNRFGNIFKYDDGDIKNISRKAGQRLVSAQKTVVNNFNEWRKFQRYAEYKL